MQTIPSAANVRLHLHLNLEVDLEMFFGLRLVFSLLFNLPSQCKPIVNGDELLYRPPRVEKKDSFMSLRVLALMLGDT